MGLLLSPNKSDSEAGDPILLDAAQLREESFRSSQLVVLSACSSGRWNQENVNPNGMVRTLLAFGVPHVVASRWNVDSRATEVLMRSFYKALFEGQSPPQALRHAREVVMANPGTSHPYYWTAFAAFGRA